jgi:DNA-binding transcriptional regulator YiaG
MTRANRFRGRYVHAEDFRDLRKSADLTRKQAADVLDVAVRTIQNWETGGARIPWMACLPYAAHPHRLRSPW